MVVEEFYDTDDAQRLPISAPSGEHCSMESSVQLAAMKCSSCPPRESHCVAIKVSTTALTTITAAQAVRRRLPSGGTSAILLQMQHLIDGKVRAPHRISAPTSLM